MNPKQNLDGLKKAYTKKQFEKARQIKINDSKSEILNKIKAFSYKNYDCVYIKLEGSSLRSNANKTIIIAEAGVNHNGKIAIAKKLIDTASKAGADYVKFQTFDVNELIKKYKTAVIREII